MTEPKGNWSDMELALEVDGGQAPAGVLTAEGERVDVALRSVDYFPPFDLAPEP